MSKQNGWWQITFDSLPCEADLEAIGKLVKKGYREGELVECDCEECKDVEQ